MSITIYYGEANPIAMINTHDLPEVELVHMDNYVTSNSSFLYIECYGKHFEPFVYGKVSLTMEKKPGEYDIYTDPEKLPELVAPYVDTFGITDEMKRDARDGKLKILLSHAMEGYYNINTDYIQALLDVPKHSIIWLTGDFNTKDKLDIESYYINLWERFTLSIRSQRSQYTEDDSYDYLDLQIERIKKKHIRPYTSTFYNRRIRYHRIIAMAAFYKRNALKNLIWSWGGEVDGQYGIFIEDPEFKERTLISALGEEYRDAIDEVITWKNLQNGNPTTENLNINLVDTINNDHVYNTYYQIVNETWASENYDTNFLSEKSFKPFLLGQPFIQHGDAGNINCLKQLGYHVFDNIFDHTYNQATNSTDRLHQLIDQILKTDDMWMENGPDILYDNLDYIISNHENLRRSKERVGIPVLDIKF